MKHRTFVRVTRFEVLEAMLLMNLKTEALRSSETSVTIYQSTHRIIFSRYMLSLSYNVLIKFIDFLVYRRLYTKPGVLPVICTFDVGIIKLLIKYCFFLIQIF